MTLLGSLRDGTSEGKGSVLKTQIFPPKICLTHAMSVTFKGIFDQYSTLSQSTCESRFRLGLLGLYALEHHNFEQRWKDASMEDRRKHVLIGLSRSCAIARNLNDARMYCGDVLKLGHLSQDAQVLLDLLTDIIPEDCSIVPKTPNFFPNAVWNSSQAMRERSGMNELEKVHMAEAMILRTKLIC